LGEISPEEVGFALTNITDATLTGALKVIHDMMQTDIKFLVVAMGRYGGAELGYGSDADVMFCYADGQNPEQAQTDAHSLANNIRSLLMAPSPDPELSIDTDLRPEGKSGPLVRSFDSFKSYYERWSSGWETQALLRANISAGDPELADRFIGLINPIRFKEEGLPELELREIRRLKARMEAERLPRGIDPTLHTKLGPGGLSDVEWMVQIIQLKHGFANPKLQTTKTIEALRAAIELGFISAQDGQALIEAWLLSTRVRNALMLVKGKASDSLPTDLTDLARIAYILGYGSRSGQKLTEDYRRTTRRARQVIMREFYGETSGLIR